MQAERRSRLVRPVLLGLDEVVLSRADEEEEAGDEEDDDDDAQAGKGSTVADLSIDDDSMTLTTRTTRASRICPSAAAVPAIYPYFLLAELSVIRG